MVRRAGRGGYRGEEDGGPSLSGSSSTAPWLRRGCGRAEEKSAARIRARVSPARLHACSGAVRRFENSAALPRFACALGSRAAAAYGQAPHHAHCARFCSLRGAAGAKSAFRARARRSAPGFARHKLSRRARSPLRFSPVRHAACCKSRSFASLSPPAVASLHLCGGRARPRPFFILPQQRVEGCHRKRPSGGRADSVRLSSPVPRDGGRPARRHGRPPQVARTASTAPPVRGGLRCIGARRQQ